MDYVGVTERFVATQYPHATIALIAGSTGRGERTETSDVDLLLIGDDLFADDSTSQAATFAFEGEVFEVFAYTPAGFDEWAARDITHHRPVILHMLMEGLVVRDDGLLAAMRTEWGPILDAGPVLTDAECALRRYIITDALDDLRDATDPLEQRILAAILFEKTAELMLLTAGRWIATGKWLPRRLRSLDAARADALAEPLLACDFLSFVRRVEHELARAGGRVQDGFVR